LTPSPIYLECYPTIGALLAREQESGRLRVRPALLRLGGEGLADGEYKRIRTAFGANIGTKHRAANSRSRNVQRTIKG